MQPISELDLYHLAMEEPWFAEDPVSEFDKARAKHPWLASSNLGHVITHYPVVRELFSNEERMRTSFDEMVDFMGAKDTPWGSFQHRHILNQSGAEHKMLRDTLALAFTPREANRHRDLMRATIHHVADEETVLLPQAESLLAERLGELGARMAKIRTQLHVRIFPKAAILIGAGALLTALLAARQFRRHA